MYSPSRFGEGRAFKTDRLRMRIGLFAVNVCMPSAGFRRAGNPIDVSYGS